MDPRIEAYAKLLVERSLDVQPGWQVWINSSWLARALVQEVVRATARRGAYPLVRLGDAGMEDVPFEVIWALEAPEEALSEVAPADRHAWETMDAWMNIGAPENTTAGVELSPEREALLAKARYAMRTRRISDEIPWVACRFPTPALAQDARMSLPEFEDFLYGACLRDWDAEAERMGKIKERFDRASKVRLVGAGTDLTLSLEGREGEVDAGRPERERRPLGHGQGPAPGRAALVRRRSRPGEREMAVLRVSAAAGSAHTIPSRIKAQPPQPSQPSRSSFSR